MIHLKGNPVPCAASTGWEHPVLSVVHGARFSCGGPSSSLCRGGTVVARVSSTRNRGPPTPVPPRLPEPPSSPEVSSQPSVPAQQGAGDLPSLQASYLMLVGVSLLWGGYGPSVSWLLHSSEHAMSAPTLTALRTFMSAMVMLSVTCVSNMQSGGGVRTTQLQGAGRDGQYVKPQESGLASTSLDAMDQALSLREPQQQLHVEQAGTSGHERPGVVSSQEASVPLLARTIQGVIPAGIELGVWNFVGTALSVTGLEFTSPTRAGFLIQLTAVGTPMMAALAGIPIPKRTIMAALIALSGTCLISLDDTPSATIAHSSIASMGSSLGDLLFLGSCLFFSLATMRLSLYAPKYNSIQLATSKKVTLGVLSMAWLVATSKGTGLTADWTEVLTQQSAFEWLVITCSALGPGALAAFLQTSGQSRVPATMAQVIYSLTPLWSALAAWLVLGDEAGPLTWAGGAIIMGASLLATTGTTSETGNKALEKKL